MPVIITTVEKHPLTNPLFTRLTKTLPTFPKIAGNYASDNLFN